MIDWRLSEGAALPLALSSAPLHATTRPQGHPDAVLVTGDARITAI